MEDNDPVKRGVKNREMQVIAATRTAAILSSPLQSSDWADSPAGRDCL